MATTTRSLIRQTVTLDFEPKPKRLTKAQAAKVRSMMEDEGCSRAEAVAWVRHFELAPEDIARVDSKEPGP